MKTGSKTLIVALMLLSPGAFAVDLPQYLNLDGQLMNDSTALPMVGPVQMLFQIYDPSENCLIYQEEKSSVPLDEEGNFSVKIGPGGGGNRMTAADGGLLWKTIFQNDIQVRGPGTNCAGGYTPAVGHGRKLKVTVNGVALTPSYNLAPSPFATVAETLQGKTPANFLSSSGDIVAGGHLKITTGNELRFSDSVGINMVGFKAPGSISTPVVWALPGADGSSGYILSTDGGGNLEWVPPGGGSGDLVSANNLSDVASTSTARANLGLAIGSDVQAYDPQLSGLAAIDPSSTNSYLLGSDGSNLVMRSPTAARADLGLGTIATQDSGNYLMKAGDTMTGPLDMGTHPITNMGALDMGAHPITNLPVPTVGTEAVNKDYVDYTNMNQLFLDGSAMMVGNLRMGGNWLSNDGDSEGVYVDFNGNVGIGTSIPMAQFTIVNNASFATLMVSSESNTYYPVLGARRARTGSAPTAMSDILLSIKGFAYTGYTDATAASIDFISDDTPSTSYAAGKISFKTAASGATPAERMVITKDGKVGIGTSNPGFPFEVRASGGDAIINIETPSGSNYAGAQFVSGGMPVMEIGGSSSLGGGYIRAKVSSTPQDRILFPSTGEVQFIKNDGSTIGTQIMNGQVKLTVSGAAPVACNGSADGVIALTSAYKTCVCKGGNSSWVLTSDGTSTCTW